MDGDGTDGIPNTETRRGEIIDIDGNHFEFHYVESTAADGNLSTTQLILPQHQGLVRTFEGKLCFQQNLTFPLAARQLDLEKFGHVSDTETRSAPENQETAAVQQRSPEVLDTQSFQLENSDLRYAPSETGGDSLKQNDFFLTCLSQVQFSKLPELSDGTTLDFKVPVNTSIIAAQSVSHSIQNSVLKGISKESALLKDIPVVQLSDDEGDQNEQEIQRQDELNLPLPVVQNCEVQLVPSRPPPEFLDANIPVLVPEGVSFEMQKYIFTQGLCRICLLVKNDLSPLFEDVALGVSGFGISRNRGENSFNILSAIKTLLDLDVNNGDSLPAKICSDCLDTLTAFSTFRKAISMGQLKLSEIMSQVKNSLHPTVIPPLGEPNMARASVFRQADSIVCAKKILSTSSYSHFVIRDVSDRVWNKIFSSLSLVTGVKSAKFKELSPYILDPPYVTGWFCYHCNTTVHGSRDIYMQHIGSHIIEQPGAPSTEICHPYPCDVCGGSFFLVDQNGNSEGYIEHWVQHFFFCECDICGKRMPSMKSVWIHKRSAHSDAGDRTFKCKTCEKAFARKVHLVNHEKTHLNRDERKAYMNWCSICEKHLTNSLKIHMPRVHSDNRPWKCEHCGKTFKDRAVLNNHRDTVHTEQRKYQCEICGESFKTYSVKRLHILRHKGERPHACDYCDKRFYTTTSLKSHLLKHTTVPGIECNICQKSFKRKIYLEEHLTIHTGEKPHECPFCGKKIRMKSNYFKHLGIHKKRGEMPMRSGKHRTGKCDETSSSTTEIINENVGHIHLRMT